MPILSYTTKVSAEKTATEVQRKLVSVGANAILTEYDNNNILSAMSFRIVVNGVVVSFRLPVNTDGVYASLKGSATVPNKLKTREQAARVSWRILKTWVDAQVALIESEMASVAEVFLPYAQDDTGRTVYELAKENGFKTLTQQ